MSSNPRPRVALAFFPGLERLLLPEAERAELERVAQLLDPAPLGAHDETRRDALLGEAQVLLSGWGCPELDASFLAKAPALELVAHAAGTVKSLVSDALFERGVRVTTAAAANAVPVAEFTLATILLANKDAFGANQRYHTRGAVAAGVGSLVGNRGKRVGLVGASRIGRLVLELLQPFDLEVVLFDPYLGEDEARALGAEKLGLVELLETSDVVSVHAPLLPETTGLIGKAELAAMRDGATLINTARGRLVDAVALEAELTSGRLRAVIDTSDPEPLPDDSPLRGLENVFLTPHIAGSLGNEIPRMTALAIGEIKRFARGERLQHEVRAEDLERMA